MKYIPVLTVGIIALGWGSVALLNTTKAHAASGMLLEPIVHQPYDATLIDKEISFHEERVKNDPKGAIGWGMLAGAYLARSRESDADVFAWKAEDAARMSLKCRTDRNDVAQIKLTQAELEQHRFQDALIEARKVKTIKPDAIEGDKLAVDTLIEMGRYEEAEKLLATIKVQKEDYAPATALARLANARGDHEESIRLYNKALTMAMKLANVNQQTIAWYKTKIATEYELLGKVDESRKLYEESLQLYPNSYKATLGMGRLAVMDKNADNANKWGNRTLEIANSLDARAILEEAARLKGDTATATKIQNDIRKQFEDEVATFTAKGKGGPYGVRPIDRQFATYCAKNGVFLAEALPAAKRDLANRPDPTAHKNLATIEAGLK